MEIVFEIFGPLSVISLFVIGSYLYRKRLYTAWQIRAAFFWPELIIKYRDHTKQVLGHIGIWYYIIIVSIALSLVSILSLFSIEVVIPLIRKTSGH